MALSWLPLLLLAAAPNDAGARARLQAGMRANVVQVVILQPYLVSPSAFRNPANERMIRHSIEGLMALRHFMRTGLPGESSLATIYGDEIDRARAEFARGEKDAARIRLTGLTSMCLACHSRTIVEQDYQDLGRVVEQLATDTQERARLYAVTRQFAKARAAWAQALAVPPLNDSEAADQSKALRLAVVTLVRAEGNPSALLELLEPQVERTDFPGFFRRDLWQWVLDLEAWRANPVDLVVTPPRELVDRARALIATTRAAALPIADDRFLVPNMRAAAMLQEALDREPSGTFRGEALYLLAVASSTEAEPALWQLDAMYLEACIRENPGSAIARRCAERLSDRMTYAYTGVRGGPLPVQLSYHLGELRRLALGPRAVR